MQETGWQDVIKLPVVTEKNLNWSIRSLEAILKRSIKECALNCLERNGGIVGMTISGGLDSSYCLFRTRQALGNNAPISTFTIGGSDKHPDIIFARKVSKLFHTKHNEFIPTGKERDAARQGMSTLWTDEEPEDGDIAVYLMYEHIAKRGFKAVIAHDGIDELLGGYWEHRCHLEEDKIADVFRDYWSRLEAEHLQPLFRKAVHFGIQVILPYLDREIVEYVSAIPVTDRTSFASSKKPLRGMAAGYLPQEIISRKKFGFCSALEL